MTIKLSIPSDIPPEEPPPLVDMLLEVIHGQQEQIQQLKDEIARLKGQTPKPTIKPSIVEKPGKPEAVALEKRPGSAKLPAEIAGSHFGTVLQSYILYQYYHAHVTQPL